MADPKTWKIRSREALSLEQAFIPPLRIASWNIMNFGLPPDELAKNKGFAKPIDHATAVAETIVKTLNKPDIIALQEVGGDYAINDTSSGKTTITPTVNPADQTVSATKNMELLCNAIQKAGGPAYRYIEVARKKDNRAGKATNIRCGFLYRPDRVTLHDTGSVADHKTAAAIITKDGKPHLSGGNPVYLGPENKEFTGGLRPPLVAEFIDQKSGETYFISNVHFVARMRGERAKKAGLNADQQQQENEERDADRLAQAEAVDKFNQSLLGAIGKQPKMHVITLGDFNATLDASNDPDKAEQTLPQPVLSALEQSGMQRACRALNQRNKYGAYTINEENTLDTVDHVFVSPELAKRIGKIERVNVIDTKGKPAASDHNPSVININPEKLIRQSAGRQ